MPDTPNMAQRPAQRRMGLTEAVSAGMKKFLDFHGRASRSAIWWLYGFIVIFATLLSFVLAPLGWDKGTVGKAVNIVLFLPLWAAGARRLHDTGHSGWWMLLALTIVGWIPLYIIFCLPSKPAANRYGPMPCLLVPVSAAGRVPMPPTLGFGEAAALCLRKCTEFRGRGSRSEFWWFSLFLSLFGAAAGIIMGVSAILGRCGMINDLCSTIVNCAYYAFQLTMLLPYLAAGSRRLHDAGYSGWWLLLICTGVGGIALTALWCHRSQAAANRYGTVPFVADPWAGQARHLPRN